MERCGGSCARRRDGARAALRRVLGRAALPLCLALHAAGLLLATQPDHAWAQSAAQIARGKELVEASCFLCHGMQGESTSEIFPRLSGQHAEYIARQLENFRSGRRKSTQMADMVRELSSADMRALGVYFESQTPLPQPPVDPSLAAIGKAVFLNGNSGSGVPACASCHGAFGAGTAELPRLAGQFEGYLQNQLEAYKSRAREHALMTPIAANLTETEIRALAAYLQVQ